MYTDNKTATGCVGGSQSATEVVEVNDDDMAHTNRATRIPSHPVTMYR